MHGYLTIEHHSLSASGGIGQENWKCNTSSAGRIRQTSRKQARSQPQQRTLEIYLNMWSRERSLWRQIKINYRAHIWERAYLKKIVRVHAERSDLKFPLIWLLSARRGGNEKTRKGKNGEMSSHCATRSTARSEERNGAPGLISSSPFVVKIQKL